MKPFFSRLALFSFILFLSLAGLASFPSDADASRIQFVRMEIVQGQYESDIWTFRIYARNIYRGDIGMWVDGCSAVNGGLKIESSSRATYSCRMQGVGSKEYHINDRSDGTRLAEGYVQVAERNPISVTSITPSQAKLNEKTVFTVYGSNLPDTLALWIHDCPGRTGAEPTYIETYSSTYKKFECTPSYTSGWKSYEVKDRSGGTVKKSGSIYVNPPAATVTSVSVYRDDYETQGVYAGLIWDFTITGENLPSTLDVKVDGCNEPTSFYGEYNYTQQSVYYTCRMNESGARKVVVRDREGGRELYSTWVYPKPYPTFHSITPTSFVLNELTEFEVFGTNFPPSVKLHINECQNIKQIEYSSNRLLYSCLPSYTTGFKTFYLKLEQNGYNITQPANLIEFVQPVSPDVFSVTPAQLPFGKRTTITINGEHFDSNPNLTYYIEECTDRYELSRSDTKIEISCIPKFTLDTKQIQVKEYADGGSGQAEIYYDQFHSVDFNESEYSITWDQAILGEVSTFTVQGPYLPASLSFWVDGCRYLTPTGDQSSETYRTFTCIPDWEAIVREGKIADEHEGNVMKAFSVEFSEQDVIDETDPVSPDVFSVSPAQLPFGKRTTITINGEHFDSNPNLTYYIEECTDRYELSRSDTKIEISCIPKFTLDTKQIQVKEYADGGSGQAEIYYDQFHSVDFNESEYSITWDQAILGEVSTFTVQGPYLPASLSFWVDGCRYLTPTGDQSSETYRTFTCIPDWEAIVREGEIADEHEGNVMKAFSVEFSEQEDIDEPDPVVDPVDEGEEQPVSFLDPVCVTETGFPLIDLTGQVVSVGVVNPCTLQFSFHLEQDSIVQVRDIQNNLGSIYYRESGVDTEFFLSPLARGLFTTLPDTSIASVVYLVAGDYDVIAYGGEYTGESSVIDFRVQPIHTINEIALKTSPNTTFQTIDESISFSEDGWYELAKISRSSSDKGDLLIKPYLHDAHIELLDNALEPLSQQLFKQSIPTYESKGLVYEVSGDANYLLLRNIDSSTDLRLLGNHQYSGRDGVDFHCDPSYESWHCINYSGTTVNPGQQHLGMISNKSDFDIFPLVIDQPGFVTISLEDSVTLEFGLFKSDGEYWRSALSNQAGAVNSIYQWATGTNEYLLGPQEISLYLEPGQYYLQVNAPYVSEDDISLLGVIKGGISLGQYIGSVPKNAYVKFAKTAISLIQNGAKYSEVKYGPYVLTVTQDTSKGRYSDYVNDFIDFGVISEQDFEPSGEFRSSKWATREKAAGWVSKTILLPQMDLTNIGALSDRLPECGSIFSDVDSSVSGCRFITHLFNTGVITLPDSGTFRPYDTVNRAEFVRMVRNALIRDEHTHTCDANRFTDVQASDWFCEDATTLYSLGIIDGNNPLALRPSENISQGEMIEMLEKAFIVLITGEGLRDDDFDLPEEITIPEYPTEEFSVYYDQNSWATESISKMFLDQVFWNQDFESGFNEYGYVRRRDFARWVYRAAFDQLPPVCKVEDGTPFTDVAVSDKDCSYITALKEWGVVSGVGGGNTFNPDGLLNRAEAAKMLRYAYFGASGPSDQCYSILSSSVEYNDVSTSDWFCDDVYFLTNNSIIRGYSTGGFGPADNLIVREIAALLHRAEGANGHVKRLSQSQTIPSFRQVNSGSLPDVQLATEVLNSNEMALTLSVDDVDSNSFYPEIWGGASLSLTPASGVAGSSSYNFILNHSNSTSDQFEIIVRVADDLGNVVKKAFAVKKNSAEIEETVPSDQDPVDPSTNPDDSTDNPSDSGGSTDPDPFPVGPGRGDGVPTEDDYSNRLYYRNYGIDFVDPDRRLPELIYANSSVSGYLNSETDKDTFQFFADQSALYDMSFSTDIGLKIEFFSHCSEDVSPDHIWEMSASSMTQSIILPKRLSFELSTYPYCLRIASLNANDKGSYQLSYGISSKVVSGDDYPDLIEDAAPGIIAAQNNYNGVISSDTDIDYFVFTPEQTRYYAVETSSDVSIEVLTQDGALIDDAFEPVSSGQKLVTSLETGESYYVRMTNDTSTNYRFSFRPALPPETGTGGGSSGQTINIAQAIPLTIQNSVNHNNSYPIYTGSSSAISLAPNETKLYRFFGVPSRLFTQTRSINGSEGKIEMRLFDNSGEEVSFAEYNHQNQQDAVTIFNAKDAEAYYVQFKERAGKQADFFLWYQTIGDDYPSLPLAYPVEIGQTQTGSFSNPASYSDEDAFVFRSEQAGQYQFDFVNSINLPIRIQDESGVLLYSDAGASLSFALELEADTIYQLIFSNLDGPQQNFFGSYSFSISFLQGLTEDDAGDTPLTAREMQGLQAFGFIEEPGDVDLFRFTASGRSGVYQIGTTGVPQSGLKPSSGKIYDSAGNLLGEANGATQDYQGHYTLFTELISGEDYFVSVSYNNGGVGDYTVTILPPSFVSETDDHSDSPINGTRISNSQTVAGSIEAFNDIDYFLFDIPEDGDYTFNRIMRTDQITLSYVDEIGRVFPLNQGLNFIRGGQTIAIRFHAISLYGSSQGSFNPSYGSYSFSLTLDEYSIDDHSNQIDGATVIEFEQSIPSHLGRPGDKDFFVFTPEVSKEYLFVTHGGTKLEATLYNPQEQAWVHDLFIDGDFSGAENNISLSANLIAGQSYYLEIRSVESDVVTDYTLSLVDVDDYQGSLATTAELVDQQETLGGLQFVGDQDWFKVVAPVAEIYSFTVSSDIATKATIYTAGGFPFAVYTVQAGEELTFTQQLYTAEYYIGISSQTPTMTGSYSITYRIPEVVFFDNATDLLFDRGVQEVTGLQTGQAGVAIEQSSPSIYYRFTADNSAFYALTSTSQTIDVRIDLFTEAGLLLSSFDALRNEQTALEHYLSAGQIYIAKLTRIGYSGTGVAYTSFAVNEVAPQVANPSDDHGDVFDQATEIITSYVSGDFYNRAGQPLAGSLEVFGDKDVFVFDVNYAGRFDLYSQDAQTQLLATLYNANNTDTHMTFSQSFYLNGERDGLNYQLASGNLLPGRYYVVVEAVHKKRTTPYTLYFEDRVNNYDDYGDDFAHAEPYTIGDQIDGLGEVLGDVDLFKFTASEDGAYTLTKTTDTQTGELLIARADNGAPFTEENKLLSNVDSGNQEFVIQLESGRQYYLGLSTATAGAYTLQLLPHVIEPTPDPEFTSINTESVTHGATVDFVITGQYFTQDVSLVFEGCSVHDDLLITETEISFTCLIDGEANAPQQSFITGVYPLEIYLDQTLLQTYTITAADPIFEGGDPEPTPIIDTSNKVQLATRPRVRHQQDYQPEIAFNFDPGQWYELYYPFDGMYHLTFNSDSDATVIIAGANNTFLETFSLEAGKNTVKTVDVSASDLRYFQIDAGGTFTLSYESDVYQDFSNATVLQVNDLQQASVDSNPIVYQFTVPTVANYELRFDDLFDQSSESLRFSVFTENESLIDYASARRWGGVFDIDTTYYVMLTSDQATTAEFGLYIFGHDEIDVPDQPEPQTDTGNGQAVARILELDVPYTETINEPIDNDFYRFTATEAGVYGFHLAYDLAEYRFDIAEIEEYTETHADKIVEHSYEQVVVDDVVYESIYVQAEANQDFSVWVLTQEGAVANTPYTVFVTKEDAVEIAPQTELIATYQVSPSEAFADLGFKQLEIMAVYPEGVQIDFDFDADGEIETTGFASLSGNVLTQLTAEQTQPQIRIYAGPGATQLFDTGFFTVDMSGEVIEVVSELEDLPTPSGELVGTYALTPSEASEDPTHYQVVVSTTHEPIVYVEIDHDGDGVFEQRTGVTPDHNAQLPIVPVTGNTAIRILSDENDDIVFDSGFVPVIANGVPQDIYAETSSAFPFTLDDLDTSMDPSLVELYEFDGTLDSGISGGQSATSIGSVSFEPAIAGNGIRLDGASGLNMPHIISTPSFTIGMQVIPEYDQINDKIVTLFHQANFTMSLVNGKLECRLEYPGAPVIIQSQSAITGENDHVGCSVEAGVSMKLYVNDINETEIDLSDKGIALSAIPGTSVTVGYRSSFTQYYIGLIDRLRIWNKALSIGEIYTAVNGAYDNAGSPYGLNPNDVVTGELVRNGSVQEFTVTAFEDGQHTIYAFADNPIVVNLVDGACPVQAENASPVISSPSFTKDLELTVGDTCTFALRYEDSDIVGDYVVTVTK